MTLGRSKLAKLRKERHAKAVAFFMEHAGYSYDPKTETPEKGKRRCAEFLALAEEYAFERDWEFRWENDWHTNHQKEFGYEPSTCEYCQLVNRNGDVLASLGCIDDATAQYRRVVQAELALEAAQENGAVTYQTA